MQSKIAALRGEGVEVVDIDDERAKAIAQQYDEDMKKLQKIRQMSARRARETVVLQRKIDDVPSRAELTQYQRRFVELYEQGVCICMCMYCYSLPVSLYEEDVGG